MTACIVQMQRPGVHPPFQKKKKTSGTHGAGGLHRHTWNCCTGLNFLPSCCTALPHMDAGLSPLSFEYRATISPQQPRARAGAGGVHRRSRTAAYRKAQPWPLPFPAISPDFLSPSPFSASRARPPPSSPWRPPPTTYPCHTIMSSSSAQPLGSS
jgi:hypothetical protein